MFITVTITILHPTITNIPVNDIKISIKQKINSMAELLGSHPGFQQTDNIKKCTKKWHIPQNLNRRQEVILTRVITQIFFF